MEVIAELWFLMQSNRCYFMTESTFLKYQMKEMTLLSVTIGVFMNVLYVILETFQTYLDFNEARNQ